MKEVRFVGLSAFNCGKFNICCNLLGIFFFVFTFLRGLIVVSCKLSFSPLSVFQTCWGAWEPVQLQSGNLKVSGGNLTAAKIVEVDHSSVLYSQTAEK